MRTQPRQADGFTTRCRLLGEGEETAEAPTDRDGLGVLRVLLPRNGPHLWALFADSLGHRRPITGELPMRLPSRIRHLIATLAIRHPPKASRREEQAPQLVRQIDSAAACLESMRRAPPHLPLGHDLSLCAIDLAQIGRGIPWQRASRPAQQDRGMLAQA
jgi:hypothetical protein